MLELAQAGVGFDDAGINAELAALEQPVGTQGAQEHAVQRVELGEAAAVARSLGRFSKKPTMSTLRYTTGSMSGRPPREVSA